MKEEEQQRKYPSNRLLKFLIRLRESGLIRAMPGNYCKVLNVLLSYRNEHGNCWPAHKTIAAKAGVSERTAIRAINYFVACIGISKKRGNKRIGFANFYNIPFESEITVIDSLKRGDKPKQKKEKIENAKIRGRGVTLVIPFLMPSIVTPGVSNQNRRKNTLKEVEEVLRNTTKSLTKRKKRRVTKIDAGENAWSKTLNALEEKTKNEEEAKQ